MVNTLAKSVEQYPILKITKYAVNSPRGESFCLKKGMKMQ